MRMRASKKASGFETKINLPGIKLSLKSNDPVPSLKEINKILYSLRMLSYDSDVYPAEDDELFFRLGYISDELKNDDDSMSFIKKALSVEDSCRVKKIALEATKIIDLNSNESVSKVDLSKARQKVNHICKGMERTNYALVHLQGNIDEQEKDELLDLFRNRLQNCQIKTVLSEKDMLGKAVVEAIFFGPFEDELL